jgi:fructokinase
MTWYGGIEAGGTKWVCAVGAGPGDLHATTRFPTTTPEETLGRAIAFFKEHPPIAAIGIGSFGPIDVQSASPTFGYITTTPKPGWRNTDVVGPIAQALGVPVGFDTDVNAAALGELRWGAAQGLDTVVYLTVGTGIGGGVVVAGNLLHGLLHPEIGHMRIPHDWSRDSYAGACPYHGDCLEGLAAGPALAARWGQRGEQFAPDHPAWELEAHYLALALNNLICTLSPQRIILGGGVLRQPALLARIHQHVQTLLNGYVQAPQIEQSIDTYITLPGLGDQSGVLGAIALAQQAA